MLQSDQNYTFCPIFEEKKIGLDMQDFSTVKYRGRNKAFFQRTEKVGIPR